MTRDLAVLLVLGALCVQAAELQDLSEAQLRPRRSVTVEQVPDLYVEREGGKRTFLFVGSFRCDSRGHVYFVPATPATLDRLDRVVRISPEGTLVTQFPGSVSNGRPLKPAVRSVSIGPDGRLHVLLQTEGADSVGQRIVPFTAAGEEDAAQNAIQIDTLQIVGRHFAVVGTGDVVVLGQDPQNGGERMVLVSRKGAVSREIRVPEGTLDTLDRRNPPGFTWLGSGSNGLAYLVREGTRQVVAISPAGEVVSTFDLLPPVSTAMKLLEVHVAGGRIAAVYRSEIRTGRWIYVQDLASGAFVGGYGPVTNPVVCYQRGEPDSFTLLSTAGGVWRLTHAEAP